MALLFFKCLHASLIEVIGTKFSENPSIISFLLTQKLPQVYNAPTHPLTEFWVALMGLTEKLQQGKDKIE